MKAKEATRKQSGRPSASTRLTHGEGEPCGHSRQLLVLSPGRTHLFAEPLQSFASHPLIDRKLFRKFGQLLFTDALGGNVLPAGGSRNNIAIKFTLRSVNEGVRREDLAQ